MLFEFENQYFYIKLKTKDKMKNIARNWKTTLLGIATVIYKAVAIKHNNWQATPEDMAVITTGIGLIFSKDADKTGRANDSGTK